MLDFLDLQRHAFDIYNQMATSAGTSGIAGSSVIDYKSLLNQDNFELFLINIINVDKNSLIVTAAKEILFEVRGNKNLVQKSWYNLLYQKYKFKLGVSRATPPKNKLILFEYKTITIPGSVVVTTKNIPWGSIEPPKAVAVKAISVVPYRTYVFGGYINRNITVCLNGGAEVIYSYKSKRTGSDTYTAVFYSTTSGCPPDPQTPIPGWPPGSPLLIKACLPSDATDFKLLNGNEEVSGIPNLPPVITTTICSAEPILLTKIGSTIDTLILNLTL
jgi:hypothetical protein